ncbi:MAG TPA: serine/threonine-protein kinase [Kofleriaceae bacterium]|nr:serine/threonine-protein kinase [Kofleriaceae bacterium]
MRQLADRFELRTWIGSGGMADVHLALDRELDRHVALKILRRELLDDEIAVARFRREALLLGMLDSPHVVTIHDVHIGPELAYLVLRHVPGRTLDTLIAEEGALTPRRAMRVVGGVIVGLRELHARRLVHRDLTPGNVIVDDADCAVLLDLGVARDRRRRSLTPADAAIGTPGFLPPELEHGTGTIDGRTDQYQVGLLMLLALTGVAPEAGPDAVGEALETVGPPLRAVIARALAPRPGDRFDDVIELGDALENAVLALEMRAKRVSPPPAMTEPAPPTVPEPTRSDDTPRPIANAIARRTVSMRSTRKRQLSLVPLALFIAGLLLGITLTLTLT